MRRVNFPFIIKKRERDALKEKEKRELVNERKKRRKR
jgi:hypothetical protein